MSSPLDVARLRALIDGAKRVFGASRYRDHDWFGAITYGHLEMLLDVYEAAATARDKAAIYDATKSQSVGPADVPAWMERCREAGRAWMEAIFLVDAAVDRARAR